MDNSYLIKKSQKINISLIILESYGEYREISNIVDDYSMFFGFIRDKRGMYSQYNSKYEKSKKRS